MNHMLKKVVKYFDPDKNGPNHYINFNYYIRPHIKETSIRPMSDVFNCKIVAVDLDGANSSYNITVSGLDNEVETFHIDIFKINNVLYGFVYGDFMNVRYVNTLMSSCRDLYIKCCRDNNFNPRSGKIYLNAKILHVSNETREYLSKHYKEITANNHKPVFDDSI